MQMSEHTQLNIKIPTILKSKIKGCAAFQNVSLRIFVVSTLMKRIRSIEKGEDSEIKIVPKEKK